MDDGFDPQSGQTTMGRTPSVPSRLFEAFLSFVYQTRTGLMAQLDHSRDGLGGPNGTNHQFTDLAPGATCPVVGEISFRAAAVVNPSQAPNQFCGLQYITLGPSRTHRRRQCAHRNTTRGCSRAEVFKFCYGLVYLI